MEKATITGHDLLMHFTGEERGLLQGKREAFRVVSSLLHGEISSDAFDMTTAHVTNTPTSNEQHAQFKEGYIEMLESLMQI